MLHDALSQSAARRIGDHQIGRRCHGLEVLLGLHRLYVHLYACPLRVESQIARRLMVGLDRCHRLETPRQPQREQAHAGIQVQRRLAGRAVQSACDQVLNQEPVHLEERAMADAEARTVGVVFQPAQIRARDVRSQPVEEALRHAAPAVGFKHVHHRLRPVGEQLQMPHEARPAAIHQHVAQHLQALIDLRRGDRALLHRYELMGSGGQESDLPAVGVELGAIAVAPRLAGDDADLFGRFDLADAAEDLAHDFSLAGGLEGGARVLVMASAAAAEDRALGLDAFRGTCNPLLNACIGESAVVVDDPQPDSLAGQREGRHDDFAVETGEAVAAVNPLLDLDLGTGRAAGWLGFGRGFVVRRCGYRARGFHGYGAAGGWRGLLGSGVA